VFLGEISSSRSHYSKKDYKGKKNEQHSYKIGTWNVRTLKRGGKLEKKIKLHKETKSWTCSLAAVHNPVKEKWCSDNAFIFHLSNNE
jgi:hypothetical protein